MGLPQPQSGVQGVFLCQEFVKKSFTAIENLVAAPAAVLGLEELTWTGTGVQNTSCSCISHHEKTNFLAFCLSLSFFKCHLENRNPSLEKTSCVSSSVPGEQHSNGTGDG